MHAYRPESLRKDLLHRLRSLLQKRNVVSLAPLAHGGRPAGGGTTRGDGHVMGAPANDFSAKHFMNHVDEHAAVQQPPRPRPEGCFKISTPVERERSHVRTGLDHVRRHGPRVDSRSAPAAGVHDSCAGAPHVMHSVLYHTASFHKITYFTPLTPI